MLVQCNLVKLRRRAAALRQLPAMIAVAFCAALLAASQISAQAPELRPANQPAEGQPAASEGSSQPAASAEGPSSQPPDDGPKLSLAEALERPGDVTFRNMTIADALYTISDAWKVNVVTGKEVQGVVNGVFKQAPLREILDAILLANGYSYRAVGESLVIQASTDVGSANPLFRSI